MQTTIPIQTIPQPSGPVPLPAADHPIRPERLLRLDDVRYLTGLGKSSIYAGIQAGHFPTPVNLTRHAVAWRESEIALWIAQRPKVTAAVASVPPTPVPAPSAAASKPPRPAHRSNALPAGKPMPSEARASEPTPNKPAMRRMVKTAAKPSTAPTSRKAPSTSTAQPKAAASASRRTSGARA